MELFILLKKEDYSIVVLLAVVQKNNRLIVKIRNSVTMVTHNIPPIDDANTNFSSLITKI